MFHFRNIVIVDLCDTVAQVNSAIAGIFGPMPDPAIFFHPAVSEPGFWADPGNRIAREIFGFAEPIPGMCGVVTRLSRTFQIVYLTARPAWARAISEKWLRLNSFPTAPVICTTDKLSWVRDNGPVAALEDAPEQIKKISSLIPVFVPPRTYNRGLGVRIGGISE